MTNQNILSNKARFVVVPTAAIDADKASAPCSTEEGAIDTAKKLNTNTHQAYYVLELVAKVYTHHINVVE